MSRPSETTRARLLLVDDEPNILSALTRVFAHEPYKIEAFTDPTAALARAQRAAFDLVLSDYRMPEVDGVSFLTIFRSLQPDCARLILSGYADIDALLGSINDAWIFRFLCKPWHDGELRAVVAQALAHRAVLLENRRLADQVRAQQERLYRQERELERLEREHPGITRVRRANDGSILLDGDGAQ
jgi:two-component system probable response regulator PhcQ